MKMTDYFNQDTLTKLENWVLKSPDGYVEIEGYDFAIIKKEKLKKICEALNLLSDYLYKEHENKYVD